jgi:hypothetical protein
MFKKGDKVKCVIYGKGRIEEVYDKLPYPVYVEFDKVGKTTNYTMDGRIFDDANPTLKHRTPKFKVGDRVKTDVWGEGVVSKIIKGDSYPVNVKFEVCDNLVTFSLDGRVLKNYPISLKKIKNKPNN